MLLNLKGFSCLGTRINLLKGVQQTISTYIVTDIRLCTIFMGRLKVARSMPAAVGTVMGALRRGPVAAHGRARLNRLAHDCMLLMSWL